MALLGAVATAILACIIVATLYFGREIFVPIALAILLSFVLAPLVGLLQHLRVPRGIAVVSVVVAAFALIFALGSLLATQLTQLAGDLPRYQSTISEKIQSIRETTAGRGTLERASGMLKDLGKELDKPNDPGSKPSSGSILAPKSPAPPSPLQVEVRQPDPGAHPRGHVHAYLVKGLNRGNNNFPGRGTGLALLLGTRGGRFGRKHITDL